MRIVSGSKANARSTVTVVEHPLVQQRLTVLRATRTTPAVFRDQLRQCAWLLGYEALRGLSTTPSVVETPLGKFACTPSGTT